MVPCVGPREFAFGHFINFLVGLIEFKGQPLRIEGGRYGQTETLIECISFGLDLEQPYFKGFALRRLTDNPTVLIKSLLLAKDIRGDW